MYTTTMTHTIAHIQILASAKQHRFATQYTYTIPATLTVSVGSVVYIPLASKIVAGVILAVESVAHPQPTWKSILAATDITIHPLHITLAQWISRYYACQLADVLYAFTPHHTLAIPQRQWNITPLGLTTDFYLLPNDERETLFAMRRHPQQTEAELLQRYTSAAKKFIQALQHLTTRGYISEEYVLTKPVASLPTQRIATLTDNTTLPPTAHAQATVVSLLRNAPAFTLPTADIPHKSALQALVKRGIVAISERNMPHPLPPPLPEPMALTSTQQHAVDTIRAAFDTHAAFLLFGITGSGKTEVYCALIRDVIAQGKQSLVLVPEIALTSQLAERFAARFPGRVVVLHGQLTPNQRTQRWQAITEQQYDVIIGPRSAVFAPIQTLGLIVVDEEHDASYKSDVSMRYNARDTALMYAKLANCPIVLGSATPSLELYAASTDGRITRLELPERVDATLQQIPRPPIRIVDLKQEATIDPHGLIGTTLAERIESHRAAQHHVLLLLNRRGSISARICRNCSATARCPTCSTPLVIHMRNQLPVGICHLCGKNSYVNNYCSECFHTDFLDIGSGTQRVYEVVHARWPHAHIIRWDSDSADSVRDYARMLQEINTSPSTIIIGTQMIAKGFDIPNIRLVGVVNTDTSLHMPDIRAAERTYQLLTQVAGRAGRRAGDAEVIFQTYKPEHYAIQAAARYDSELFYTQELQYRKRMQYPPFSRLIKLTWQHTNPARCEAQAREETDRIQQLIEPYMLTTRIIGPSPAFFARMRNLYRWHTIIATTQLRSVTDTISQQTRAIIDVEPYSLL